MRLTWRAVKCGGTRRGEEGTAGCDGVQLSGGVGVGQKRQSQLLWLTVAHLRREGMREGLAYAAWCSGVQRDVVERVSNFRTSFYVGWMR
jgi:hypothetical protein